MPDSTPANLNYTPVARSSLARSCWLAMGLIMVVVGFVGVFVPLLPTTGPLILAAACFTRSSPRLERWLLNHPRFGPGLRAWREQHAIPRRAKGLACVGMGVSFVIFTLSATPNPVLSILVATLLLASAAWVVTRPEPLT